MSPTLSHRIELGKNWAGRVVEEKFPLRQWVGGTDHSAVFLTERAGAKKAAIKLILAQGLDPDAQLARWASIAKLSHPHLMRLFECGRCQIEGMRLLYVVMEYADENLGEILPVRALTAAEASEMLPPAAEALGFVHRSGFVHGRIAPSNITAVDNQLKLSADSLRKIGDVQETRASSAYDAPEVATSGISPAADVWSLGMTLVAVLTRNEPKVNTSNGTAVAVPSSIPQPLREIARQCLQVDPQQRCTLHDIIRRLRALTADSAEKVVEPEKALQHRPKRWVLALVVLAALLVGVWLSIEVLVHRAPAPAAETQSPEKQSPGNAPATQSSAPFSAKGRQAAGTRGSVLQQVQPDVSQNALNTINGRLKVSIQVAVNASGSVLEAKFVSHGPSQYFANRAMAAAQRWKFHPPQIDGHAVASDWVLHFQFARSSVQVSPAEVKP